VQFKTITPAIAISMGVLILVMIWAISRSKRPAEYGIEA
jgi:hypothetical protein